MVGQGGMTSPTNVVPPPPPPPPPPPVMMQGGPPQGQGPGRGQPASYGDMGRGHGGRFYPNQYGRGGGRGYPNQHQQSYPPPHNGGRGGPPMHHQGPGRGQGGQQGGGFPTSTTTIVKGVEVDVNRRISPEEWASFGPAGQQAVHAKRNEINALKRSRDVMEQGSPPMQGGPNQQQGPPGGYQQGGWNGPPGGRGRGGFSPGFQGGRGGFGGRFQGRGFRGRAGWGRGGRY